MDVLGYSILAVFLLSCFLSCVYFYRTAMFQLEAQADRPFFFRLQAICIRGALCSILYVVVTMEEVLFVVPDEVNLR